MAEKDLMKDTESDFGYSEDSDWDAEEPEEPQEESLKAEAPAEAKAEQKEIKETVPVAKKVEEQPKKVDADEESFNIDSVAVWQVLAAIVAVLFVISIFTHGFNLNITGAATTNTSVEDKAAQQNTEQQAAQPTTTKPADDVPRVQVSAADAPSKGPANAPVTIIEFSDFQCPFCSRGKATMDQVVSTYGDKVRLVFRNFPLSFHQNAEKAAEAAQCANEQGKFWEYHDILFANQGALAVENLKQYAVDLKLDTAKFNSCLDSGKYAAKIQTDISDGQAAGVRGTPAFYINGRSISGAQPFENFQKVIEEELAK